MEQKLRSRLSKKILLVFALLIGLSARKLYAQATLSPGDIVVVTVNTDAPNKFDFIPLTDLEKGTAVQFTDNDWLADSAAFQGGEGAITFVAPSFISAGTVVSFDGSFQNGFTEMYGSFNLPGSGDNLLVYQGDKINPTFIYSVEWVPRDSWEYKDEAARSDKPPSLSEEKNTVLNFGTADNLQYNSLNGTEGTKNFLLKRVGDESNWIKNDEGTFSVFSPDFTLLNPPTIAFTRDFIKVNEGEGAAEISIKLEESTKAAVDVDLAFIASSSSASVTDIGSFSTETVYFSSTDTSGSIKTININLNDDDEYNGRRTAVFELVNSSIGTIISPKFLSLEIIDNDAPDVVINEILAEPENIDANGNGVSGGDDEFVEIVNNQPTDIDISGWAFGNEGIDGKFNSQYTFPEGTIIPSGRALVLFAGGPSKGFFGGAVVQTLEGGVSFNHTDEAFVLLNRAGNIIDKIFFRESLTDESLVRDTDSTLIAHSRLTGSGGSLISPGTRADGSDFAGGYSIGIRGGEGWRMLSVPTQNTSFSDLLTPFWMQGIPGSDEPNVSKSRSTILKWNEAMGGFITMDKMPFIPSGMTEEMKPGKGYIVYFFEDDNPSSAATGVQGGFPKVLHSEKKENSNVVRVDVSATDSNGDGIIASNEGWNLLGNPFARDISVEEVKEALSTVGDSLSANIYVWNHAKGGGNGGYEILDNDDSIDPYQAFFVKYMGNSELENATVDFNKSKLTANKAAGFYKKVDNRGFKFSIELHGGQYFDTYNLQFSEQGKVELDRFDAYKQDSFNRNSISLYGKLGDHNLQKAELPYDLQTNLEIPLLFSVSEQKSLTFRWDNIKSIPPDWEIKLIDKETGREIDLRVAKTYQFKATLHSNATTRNKDKSLLNKAKLKEDNPRFVLSISPPTQSLFGQDKGQESIKLNPNYPNPFNPSTTISYELTQESQVSLSIWNMIGQKVATLVDDVVEEGTHFETWSASNMPSGMYIARLEVEGQVFIRKMTLIK